MRHLKQFNVRLKHADGQLGMPEAAPFDSIIVAAAGLRGAAGAARTTGGRRSPGLASRHVGAVSFLHRTDADRRLSKRGSTQSVLSHFSQERNDSRIDPGGFRPHDRRLHVATAGADRRPLHLSAGQAGSPVAGGPGYYTVKKGDTLYRIALEHGQDYKDVVAWNNIANPNSIKEGQVLRVRRRAPRRRQRAGRSSPSRWSRRRSSSHGRWMRRQSSGPPSAASGDGVKREPRGGKEPYSDEAYARLNQCGRAGAKAGCRAGSKPGQARGQARSQTRSATRGQAGRTGS